MGIAYSRSSDSSSEEGASSTFTAAASAPSLSSASLSLPPSIADPELQCPPLPESLPPLPVNKTPRVTASVDVHTPDAWIMRNPALLRLTGKHPLNCEPPLSSLFDAGFITPAHLHFVRNHGAVPTFDEVKLRDWKIHIHGLVRTECMLSLQDLRERFQVVTLPVTLVCAGNRRKEQNVVRKSLGFSWGAAGVSTALWTGVYLADVLEYVQPIRPQARHVIFEGGDTTLPNGPYGTSQRLSWAANKERGMLIAWAMNGLPLEPDHGFPVRMIIPGQIGGRSVKWLTKIEISAEESQHHLHIFDNRVLPMQLSPEQARAEKDWWYDPRYLISELNVNSAIVHPGHDETLDIQSHGLQELRMYTIRGYAYAGGGRRVTRVEISLDDGHSWRLAEIEYPEDLYRSIIYSDEIYGKLDLTERDTCFCWCFWSFDVPVANLASSSSIAVRAMDEATQVQQRDMYLNATGMMNNWWFRVAIVKTDTGLRFEHPAPVGTESLGWMERIKATGGNVLSPNFNATQPVLQPLPLADVGSPTEVQMTNPEITRQITWAEVRAQDRERPWFVIKGQVYDGTPYLNEHPGGADSILLVAGEDATEDFMAIHSADARSKLKQFHIGTLVDAVSELSKVDAQADASSPFLKPKSWKTVKLIEVEKVNHDTCMFRFALHNSQQSLGLPVGQHVFVRLKRKDTGEVVQRAYTPISLQGVVGMVELLVKIYLPCALFPTGGKMSIGFHALRIGDTIDLKGPLGSFTWQGLGTALYRSTCRNIKEIGMVCGGSGITPILQVLRSILHDPDDSGTRIWLLYANRTEADILCREELDALHTMHGASRFSLHYTLTVPPDSWMHSTGRITDDMLAAYLPPPSPDGLILSCGPTGMIRDVVKPGLQRYGWDIEHSLVVF
ncbi:Nitrate reductase [NADPH] [Sparassis crispa]|uniref:Nitrate reductase n=1 Tax=Sparassis crispa TaxID=139825 RepID=A0A401G9D6_9APHY|nr:Nitrate reductase [NADPH] [Sparassis crispa]GBE78768.1 Nitrate reductase [NADPH] [Sparassis crispa]